MNVEVIWQAGDSPLSTKLGYINCEMCKISKNFFGKGQVAGVCAFYFDDTSLNPAEAYNVYQIKIDWKER